jgi:1,4-dihydroxy-2-naphthoate octaprenyltransferase
MVLGSFYVQAEHLSWPALLLSLPVGLLVTAVLQANNIRDIADDTEAGKRTLATYIGRRWANREYLALVFGAYVVLALIALGGVLPAGVLIVFLTLPRAVSVTRIILRRDEARALNVALRQTAGLHLQFGLLLSAVLLASVALG